MIALTALIGAGLNRYAGMETGNRYAPCALAALGVWLLGGSVALALAWGLSLLAWRSVGWYKSIDMGRNEHSLLRDIGALSLISSLPFAPLAFFLAAPGLPFATAVAVVVPYIAVMRGLPWRPEFKHIAVAEILSGAALGALVALTI